MVSGSKKNYRLPIPLGSSLPKNFPGTHLTQVFLFVFFFLSAITSGAQDKQSVQVKTFDQKLQVFRNIEIAINDHDFVPVGSKGQVIVELNSNELPIKSIRIKDDKLEAASWNFSKGIVEVIVRPKSYTVHRVVLRFANGTALPLTAVTFRGSKTISAVTNQNGEFELPLALNEKISSASQFTVGDMKVVRLNPGERENTLVVELPKAPEKKPEVLTTKEQIEDFDLSRLDSIQSLTIFYAVFRNISIRNLSETARIRIDAKFKQLVSHMQDSLARTKSKFIGSISDSSFVTADIRNLVNHATLENEILQNNRTDFENKIKVISAKLEKGISNLDADSRKNLLADLDFLEAMLIQNESKFYQNQNDYHDIINSLKEKYFDVTNLESKLSKAEKEREEEQKVFRMRMFTTVGALVVFGILIILLISFSSRLRRQAKDLKAANEEIKSINENLEGIVIKRTKLLEESNKELDTFLYRASHDLRSPIRSILGLFNIIDHIPQSELVKRVKGTTLGMDRMIKKLISISEINQSESLGNSTVLVSRAIHDAKNKHAKMIFDSGVKFHVECHEDLRIQTKPTLIDGILGNLIENAVFFSVLKNPDDASVEVKAAMKGECVEFIVTDNGVGIDESIRPKLFRMFFNGNESSQGNGLGLYTVQKCVHALNGNVSFQSEVGKFTTFTVVLPISG